MFLTFIIPVIDPCINYLTYLHFTLTLSKKTHFNIILPSINKNVTCFLLISFPPTYFLTYIFAESLLLITAYFVIISIT